MDKLTLQKLNHMIKTVKKLPPTPTYPPNLFNGSNINTNHKEYHRIMHELYDILLLEARPYGVQIEDKTRQRDGYFIFRIVDAHSIPNMRTTILLDGSTRFEDTSDRGYNVLDEILLYHDDDAKWRKANKLLLSEKDVPWPRWNKGEM